MSDNADIADGGDLSIALSFLLNGFLKITCNYRCLIRGLPQPEPYQFCFIGPHRPQILKNNEGPFESTPHGGVRDTILIRGGGKTILTSKMDQCGISNEENT